MKKEKSFRQRILETELVSGHCPECQMYTILVGLDKTFFRCTNCGYDVEQRVNGVIKYMKVDKNTKITMINDGQD